MCLKITYILFLKPFILVFGKVSTMYLSMWIEAECDSLFTNLFHHLTLSHLFWREKVWGSSFPRGTGHMLGECSCCDTRPILLTEMFPLSFWCLRGLERGRIKHSKCWEVCKWDFWKVRERERDPTVSLFSSSVALVLCCHWGLWTWHSLSRDFTIHVKPS